MSDAPHPILELIRHRVSVEEFDQEREVDETLIRELVEDATHAPSSFNIQHWRFVAVRDPDARKRLCEAAYGQEQVECASVTFIILGDLRGVERLPEVMQRAVAEGTLPEPKAQAWIRMAQELYTDPQMARDEALRSGSLAAMQLMLSAQARGLASGALIGFDAERVRQEFEIDERYVPVMLLAVGWPARAHAERQPRLGVDEVLVFDSGRSLGTQD